MLNITKKDKKENKVKKVKVAKPSVFASQEEKHSRVMEVLKKEYAIENWALAVLSPVLLLYGVYIIIGSFGSTDLTSVLGASGIGFIDFFFQTDLARIITGSVLVLIGALVIVYLILPILRPSFQEMKKVTWPTSKQLGTDIARVFTFLVFLMILFTLYGYALEPLFKWLYSL